MLACCGSCQMLHYTKLASLGIRRASLLSSSYANLALRQAPDRKENPIIRHRADDLGTRGVPLLTSHPVPSSHSNWGS